MMDISGSLFTNEYRDRHIAGKSPKKGVQKGVGSVRVCALSFFDCAGRPLLTDG